MARLLALLAAVFALYNAWGAVHGLQQLTYLSTLSLQVPLAYLIGREAVWAVLWAVASVGGWLRQRWAWWAWWGLFPLYLAWAWFDRLVLAQQPVLNWPFLLAFDAVQCGLVFLCLWWVRPHRRRHPDGISTTAD